jgi:hypothetical protein
VPVEQIFDPIADRQTDGGTNVFCFHRLPDVPEAQLDKPEK